MKSRQCLIFFYVIVDRLLGRCGTDGAFSTSASEELQLDWKLCKLRNTATNEEQGVQLSKYGPDIEKHCIPASVPGTVLSNLLANGTFFRDGVQDPYFETNLQRIPDIAFTGRDAWTYFYVATWKISNEDKHATLTLRSINYEAELWLDGVRASDSMVQGMFQRSTFPLGRLSAGTHHMAILVHPPLHPGLPGGGQGGSHDLAKDGPVSQFTGGWDWIQATPDRNTGLWDKVTLKVGGPLQLRDPTVRVRNLSVENRIADLYFSVSVENRDDNNTVCSLVSLDCSAVEPNREDGISITRHLTVVIPSGATNVSAAFPGTTMTNAQLWYPSTHGRPSLYQARFRIRKTPCNASVDTLINANDDEISFRFGIRKVEFTVNTALNGLELAVNNQKVFLQGGNWIATDQLMRFAGDRARYMAEVSLHKSMGMNMIRVWGGGITERPEFFEVCDELGMLVLSDFWMSGDNNGRWAGSYSWPLNHSLYLNAVRDTALLLRNHPSLVMYSAGNELYPTSKNPPPEIRCGIEHELKNLDPDTFLILSTMTNRTNFNPNESLCPKDGPYGMLEEALFYQRNPGLWDWKNHSHARLEDVKIAFQPEIGSSSFPTLASLLRFMSRETAESFPGYQDTSVHPTWEYHNFLGFTSQRKPFSNDQTEIIKVDLIHQYGTPSNISEYCIRAQLAQFTQFRSLFESFKLRMFEWYSAVLFWKSQSPWPSLRGGLYDNYLGVTGGYYGVLAALGNDEARLAHGQMNLADHTLSIVASPHVATNDNTDGISVCVMVNAFVLSGCDSGTLLFSSAYTVTSVQSNAVSHIPNSTIPWVGKDVTLYRVETYPAEQCSSTRDSGTPSQRSSRRISLAEYWLSDWTPNSKNNVTGIGRQEPPVQNLTALGSWRDDTSHHVHLNATAEWCGCAATKILCQQAGCLDSEIVLELENSESVNSNGDYCGNNSIAFGVWTELHNHNIREAQDTRVLPTLYSNGLFTILKGEGPKFVCMDPSLATENRMEDLFIQITGWNLQTQTIPVPQRCNSLSE